MRNSYFLFLLLALLGAAPALAQPTVDPAFAPAAVYRSALVQTVLQVSSGARIAAGVIVQADGQPANNVVRYMPGGALDAVFATNVASYTWQPRFLSEAPGGKLLVASATGTMSLGTTTGTTIARLNADGTVDASFAASVVVAGTIAALLVQPDGKVVIGGRLTALNGQPVANLVRLNSDGTPDGGFLAAGAGPNNQVLALALQPDGKLLLGGSFTQVRGTAAAYLARLLPGGGLDNSLLPRPVAGASNEVEAVAVQADGNILLSGTGPTYFSTTIVARLTSTGLTDATFSVSGPAFSYQQIQVQPDGKVVIGREVGELSRLLPTGAPDASFQFPSGAQRSVLSWQLLPNGQFLVGGLPGSSYTVATYALTVSVLNSDGTRDPSFGPHLQSDGLVADVVVQADGKIVLGGNFDEVNGTVAHGLARLLPNGTVDAAYAPQAPVEAAVKTLTLQPDGMLLVGGSFARLGGAARSGLARLLDTGAADVSFVAGTPLAGPAAVALQPDGKVLVAAGFTFVRLQPTGQLDPSFRPPANVALQLLLVQPDGRILTVISNGIDPPLQRLLPSGAADPSFSSAALRAPGTRISALALYPDGRVLVGGQLFSSTNPFPTALARFLPNGQPDLPALPPLNANTLNSLVIQPNQRILLGGIINIPPLGVAGTARVLANGTLDASYAPSQGPKTVVLKIVVQPDGKILAAGSFTTVNGLPIIGLTRLLDANVLAVPAARPAGPALTAWPVPARTALHLALDAAARPARVQLLDALGRVALTQAAVPNMMLDVRGLAPGPYVLRVDYAAGPVLRRVVVE